MNSSLQIGLLTGQSNPQSCELSPRQRRFLSQFNFPGLTLIPLNFPYSPGEPHRDMPLLRASLANLRQFLAARQLHTDSAVRAAVIAVIERAPRTLFISGSCGLHLYNSLRLPKVIEARVTVLAFGPVSLGVPRWSRLIAVQGRRDWLSRLFFRPVQHRISCSHMNYLDRPEFTGIVRDTILDQLAPN